MIYKTCSCFLSSSVQNHFWHSSTENFTQASPQCLLSPAVLHSPTEIYKSSGQAFTSCMNKPSPLGGFQDLIHRQPEKRMLKLTYFPGGDRRYRAVANSRDGAR
jgi:hypothetical protein